MNNQANLKSPFKNHQQFGSVENVCSDLFFPKHLRNKQVAKNRSEQKLPYRPVVSPTGKTNLPTCPLHPPRKVSSDPNSPTTVGSDHLGFGDFSCSSSEVGDQVFVGMPKRWSCVCSHTMYGIYIYIYLHEWLVFYGKNMVNVGIPYMDAIGIGWLCWLVGFAKDHMTPYTTVGKQLIFTGFVDAKKKGKHCCFFLV